MQILSRRTRNNPVLIGEPGVFNTLLQVLDEGRLTDNKGRTANFRNTIIIMTSNLGAHLIQQRLEQFDENNRDEIMAKVRLDVYNLLKATLPPEFLNRIDETILFAPLNREEIRQIVELQLKSLKDMLAEREFQIEFTEAALDWLAQLGYDPQCCGARPLKRVIQRKVIDELARMILANEIDKEQIINVDINDKNQVVFRNYALNPN